MRPLDGPIPNDMVQVVTVNCTPIGKPRQTRADKWKQRDCVMRYRSFADEVRSAFGRTQKFSGAPFSLSWRAYFEMPASWSKKRKAEMAGRPHRQKPDRDNIDKAILDSLFDKDEGIAFGTTAKYWDDGQGARIELVLEWEEAQRAA